jgi:hypothetical protein
MAIGQLPKVTYTVVVLRVINSNAFGHKIRKRSLARRAVSSFRVAWDLFKKKFKQYKY